MVGYCNEPSGFVEVGNFLASTELPTFQEKSHAMGLVS